MYVPFFRCESFPYISRRADWFPCALFPFPSPCTPFVFISVPCMSLSVPSLFPFHVPLLSCHVDFLFPPLIPLHFLAFPLCSPIFPAKKHGFSSVFAIRTSKNTEFSRQKEAGTPNQQRAGRAVLWNVIKLPRGPWWGGPPPHVKYVGGGGVILYPLLGVRHAEQCRRTFG